MKDFKEVLKEIRRNLITLNLFKEMFNAIEIYLMVYLVLVLLRLKTIYALLPSLLYLIIYFIKEVRRNHYKVIEKKHKELEEEIITAADNLDCNNEIVKELQKDIKQKLRKIMLSEFINMKKLSLRTLTCIVLSFIIFVVAMLNVGVNFNAFIKNIENFKYKITSGLNEGEGNASEEYVSMAKGEDIYGIEKIAELSNKEIKMIIPTISYELNLNEIKQPEERTFQDSPFPEEVFIKESQLYEDKTPEEYAKLIKDYFLRITK